MKPNTSLTARQKHILNIVAQKPSITGKAISSALEYIYPISKATLARDLAQLSHAGAIVSDGNGPSTVYRTPSHHPLLAPIDLNTYFSIEPFDRTHIDLHFSPTIFTRMHELLNDQEQLDLQKQFRSFSQSTKALDPTILRRELERFIIELAWKSSKIEGNTYSLLETETLILQKESAAGHTKEEALMILNHKSAFEQILAHKKQFKTVQKDMILQLHNILVKDLSITTGLRKNPVRITGTLYQPPAYVWEIEQYFDVLIQTINQLKHPLEKALCVSSCLAYLQPFTDGNKRTARMLANAILLAHDFFPLSYRNIDENEYKKALILFYETHNLFHIKRLFIQQYVSSLRTYFPL